LGSLAWAALESENSLRLSLNGERLQRRIRWLAWQVNVDWLRRGRLDRSGRRRGVRLVFQLLQTLVHLGSPGQDGTLGACRAAQKRKDSQHQQSGFHFVGHEGTDQADKRQPGGDDVVNLVGRQGHTCGSNKGDDASPG
jgi:hypothetical protein